MNHFFSFLMFLLLSIGAISNSFAFSVRGWPPIPFDPELAKEHQRLNQPVHQNQAYKCIKGNEQETIAFPRIESSDNSFSEPFVVGRNPVKEGLHFCVDKGYRGISDIKVDKLTPDDTALLFMGPNYYEDKVAQFIALAERNNVLKDHDFEVDKTRSGDLLQMDIHHNFQVIDEEWTQSQSASYKKVEFLWEFDGFVKSITCICNNNNGGKVLSWLNNIGSTEGTTESK